ncbi:MAG TPA: acyltransferase [Accumulibacter sp.]|uniref:acyltransferase n=1 Tax=Accumulibacter sp. TaxID=2053492 RepID=UPI002BCFD1C4|nr:acyltransferase [Accumulibacter sp.]HMW54784.1 acyltransferase [Accumulibacter sp.]HNG77950.1 acyltransferase [Burkholderiaceae bacterium]
MSKMIFIVLEKVIKLLKGKPYHLDRQIPVRRIIQISFLRLAAVARSVLHGFGPFDRIFIGKHVSFSSRSLLTVGSGTSIGSFSYFDALSRKGIRLGRNVSIGEYCRLEASGTITDIGLGIEIGDNTGIGAYSFVGGAGGVRIGSDVIMGQWVSFHPENHNYEDLDTPIRLQGVNRKGITIEDDCWIGAKATFLDGAHVGRGCVIAAGAVVRGQIPPYSIAGGVPARVLRSRKISQSAER